MAARKYMGFYDNGDYRVGCSGATVYVFDQSGAELCRFRDTPYIYSGAFQPGTNLFAAKSVRGYLAVYDPDRKTLKHKITLTHRTAHDEGFAFSPDGKLFYDIDHYRPFRTRLVLYDTEDYTVKATLFSDDPTVFLTYIEFSPKTGLCYILGYDRDPISNVGENGFIGILEGNTIREKRLIGSSKWFSLQSYQNWEKSGFTERAYSILRSVRPNAAANPLLTLENIHRGPVSTDSLQ